MLSRLCRSVILLFVGIFILVGCTNKNSHVDDFIATNTMVKSIDQQSTTSDGESEIQSNMTVVDSSPPIDYSDSDSASSSQDASDTLDPSRVDMTNSVNNSMEDGTSASERTWPVLIDMEEDVLADLIASNMRVILYFWDENHSIDQSFVEHIEASQDSNNFPVDVLFVRSSWQSSRATKYDVVQPNTFVFIDSQGNQKRRLAKGVISLETVMNVFNL